MTESSHLPTIITFGCRLNTYESEVMRAHALAAGLGNAVIVNTCAVTGEAERQARQAIRKIRRENPKTIIIVTGCAAQINPELYAAMPEVDHVVGNDLKMKPETFQKLTHEKNHPPLAGGSPALGACGEGSKNSKLFLSDIQNARAIAAHTAAVAVARSAEQSQHKIIMSDIQKTRDIFPYNVYGFEGIWRGFVQIQNGCDHRCTFCIIPYGRGPSRSVPAKDIAKQIKTLIDKGYNEIALTGVDIASYGADLPGKPTLGQAVRELFAELPGLRRLRLSSLDPAAIDEDLWWLIENEPRLMPHLHLSLQSGDDMVLKRMKRRHTSNDIRKLCARARKLRPGIAFGADVIAGFPTETEAMFENTLKLVEECDITWLHVFPYSARAGTPAAKMPQVKMETRRARAARLRAAGEKAVARHLDSLVGRRLEVLVEQQGVGRTPTFAEVKLPFPAPVGSVIRIDALKREGFRILVQLAAIDEKKNERKLN